MSQPSMTPQEIAQQGEAIYQRELQTSVEQEHLGQFLALDILSGEFYIAESDLEATTQLLKKSPNAIVYGLKIGSPAAYRIGGLAKVPHS